MPRPSAGSIESGIEITRISTKIAASAPSATTTRLSGTAGGSSTPASRAITSSSTARPMKKTSFPRTPVCQPITASLTPTPEPAYHPMNDESMSTSPATQVTRSPAAQTPLGRGRGAESAGGGSVTGSSTSKKSGVSTPRSMGINPVDMQGTVREQGDEMLDG